MTFILFVICRFKIAQMNTQVLCGPVKAKRTRIERLLIT